MVAVVLSDSDLEWLWSKRFENPSSLTVEDVLELTVDRGKDIDVLLISLETNLVYKGILSKVVERLLQSKIRELLPSEVLTDPEFDSIFSDPCGYFRTDDQDIACGKIIERYGAVVNSGSEKYLQCAMSAFVYFALRQYVLSLHQAGFALNEKSVPNFGEELRRGSLTAELALIEVVKVIASIGLETASEMQLVSESGQ